MPDGPLTQPDTRKAALTALAEEGAHFVRCYSEEEARKARARGIDNAKFKGAIAKGWDKRRAPLSGVLRHRGPVGVIPASLGCVVVDVDRGGEQSADAVIAQLGLPLAKVPTLRDDGFHLWYLSRDAAKIANGDGWRDGDIRGCNGYAVLWHPELVAEGLADTTRLPADLMAVDLNRLPPKPKGDAQPKGGEVGNRNNTLNREVFVATLTGQPTEKAVEAAREAGLPEREIAATVESATKAGEAARQTVFPRKDEAALEAALAQLGVKLRYDVRSQKRQFSEGGAFQPFNDRSTAHLRRLIGENFSYMTQGRGTSPLRFGTDTWNQYADSILYRNEVDAFIADYLNRLPVWDGVERLPNWLAELFVIEGDPALASWSSLFMVLGAVWRAYEPGVKSDEMPVLVGPQGCGKSTAVALLLPPDRREWFSAGLHLADSPQKRAEALQGRVIVEASEMAGSGRADLESLKTFLAETDDGSVRLAYRRDPEEMKRRCIIVGTSNLDTPLPADPSGNRRFVPVRIAAGNPTAVRAYLGERRDQLWAEGVARYRRGEPAWLPPELAKAQAEGNVDFTRKDLLLEEAIANWLLDREHDGRADEPFTMADLVVEANIDGGARTGRANTANRCGAVLRSQGYETRRVRRGGTRVWEWSRA